GERLVERGAERQERLSVHFPVQVEVRGLALALGEALRGDLPEAVQRDGLDVLVLGGRLGRLGPGRRRLGGRRRGGGLGGGLGGAADRGLDVGADDASARPGAGQRVQVDAVVAGQPARQRRRRRARPSGRTRGGL